MPDHPEPVTTTVPAAEPAAPDAPAGAPAPAAPPTPVRPEPPTPAAPLAVRQGARQRMLDRLTQATEPPEGTEPAAPIRDARGRLHAPEDGKYLPEQGQDAPGAEPGTERTAQPEPAAEPGAEAPGEPAAEPGPEAPEPTAPEEPSTGAAFEIVLDESHPLRDMGLDAIRLPVPLDEKTERGLRAAINGYARRAEVQQMQARLRELQAELIRERARTEVLAEKGPELLAGETEEALQEIAESYGPELAELIRQGRQQKLEQLADQKANEAQAMLEQQELIQRALDFRQTAIQDATQGIGGRDAVFPGWTLDGEYGLNAALAAYGAELEARLSMGLQAEPNPADWYRVARVFYAQHPAGQATLEQRRQQELEAAKRQAEEELREAERRRLEEAATRHATNPLGGVPATDANVRSMSPEAPGVEKAGRPPTLIRRDVRESVLQKVREAMGR